MKNLFSKMLLPAALAGYALAQTVGMDIRRTQDGGGFPGLRDIDIATIQIDTTRQADTTRTKADSLLQKADSTLEEALDSLFFGDGSPADTVPQITARDTMKVPEELRETDPFRYKWYVAIKDSLTHRIVVDSLIEAGDSLEWPLIDSLYLKDSTDAAVAAFEKKWASMSKAERKRWEYEQKLPAIMHRQDSILHLKDSLKKHRDSVIENTPRILETMFVPDSMHYKRIISWKHDSYFNRVTLDPIDTTFDYHFHDYPFLREDVNATWLGVAGSAVETYDWFKRDQGSSVSFYRPYESWTYTPDKLPMYNTKTPYTELEYYGTLLAPSAKESDNLRLFTTQNIFPQLNVTLEFKRYGGKGILQNEETTNKTSVVSANWLGKKYLAHAGLIHNKVTRTENGGLQDISWIRDTTVDVREISVNLASASNTYKKNTLFFDQSYRIPFTFIMKWKDRKEIKAEQHLRDSITATGDTLRINRMEENLKKKEEERQAYYATLDTLKGLTTVFVGSSTDYTVYTKIYTDDLSADRNGRSFFNNTFYYNPSSSIDSIRMMQLDNRVFLRVQPWADDFVISKIEGGIGDRLRSHHIGRYTDYISRTPNTLWNTVYAYAGAEGKLSRYMDWNALGQYSFLGYGANDFSLDANVALNLFPFRRHKNSPVTIKGSFDMGLREPDYFQQHFYSNHFKWDNDFGKIYTMNAEGSISVPRWRLAASAGYGLTTGHIFYDTLGVVRQAASPVNVFKASLSKEFVIKDLIHLDNRILFQYSTDQAVLPLPLVALNLRYFIQFNIVRADVMKMQIGADMRWNTPWYAPSFNPVTGTFMAQNEYLYHNGPQFDAFVNIQWKRACIFAKLENAGQGWPMDKHDYFSANRYIITDRVFKIGIYWPFYVLSGQQKALSERAGSGMGVGGGGGGLRNAMR